jgi:hypothetical protein
MLGLLEMLFPLFFDSKRSPTMNQDPLLRLIDSISTRAFDTQTFLRDIVQLAMLSPDPLAVQNRFMVNSMTHYKGVQAATIPHYFLLVELADTQRIGSEPLFIALERTASHGRPSQTHFMEHPDTTTVLESIAQTLKEVPANVLASASRSKELVASLSKSLSSSDPLSPYQAVATDELELTPSESSPSPSYGLSFFGTASLAAARTTYSSPQSTPTEYRAGDRFIGSKNLGLHANLAHNITQVCPQYLSLFDFAVLAVAVRNHDTLYSIFKQQSFWFARIICDVVAREYICTTVSSDANSVSIDDVSIPRNSYLPNLEGRWIGFKINRVEDTVTSVMVSNFRKYLQEMKIEVHFVFNLDCHLLKPRPRQRQDGINTI